MDVKKLYQCVAFIILYLIGLISFAHNCIESDHTRKEEELHSSVLSQGRWYKLELANTGIHKLDSKFLASIGIEVGNLDPRNIKLYGNGGGMLPQANALFRAEDLIENSIKIVGEEDGKFDSHDYILFYGKGPNVWQYDPSKQYFDYVKNLISQEKI